MLNCSLEKNSSCYIFSNEELDEICGISIEKNDSIRKIFIKNAVLGKNNDPLRKKREVLFHIIKEVIRDNLMRRFQGRTISGSLH